MKLGGITTALLIATAPALAAGPMSKFANSAPQIEQDVQEDPGELKRCLIDLPKFSAPIVYKQSDRPDEIVILWTNASGATTRRVDLHRLARGTHVKAWLSEKAVSGCIAGS